MFCMGDAYDIAVDFMDMTNDRRLWARPADVRPGVDAAIGRHYIVCDEGADPLVARIVSFDSRGNIELEVLRGTVESHAHQLTLA
jgi:hypothetical protein